MATVPTRTFVGPKIQNIIFTTDFSSCSDTALVYARAIAVLYGSTVHVVHVIPPEPPVIGELGFTIPEIKTDRELATEQLAHHQMDRLAQSQELRGIPHLQIIEKGAVSAVVPRLVDQLNADLIVLGTHGRHGLKLMILGSVAEQIFRRATCPVLTVGPEIQKDGLAAGKLQTILYATDFSPSSRHALEYALLLALTTKARLSLLHVMNESEPALLAASDEIVPIVRRQLAEFVPAQLAIPHDAFIEVGTPADVILETAANLGAGLIVMGAHRGASASAHAPWAIAHRVVCEAPCPVLTVRS